jgi:putative transposase
VVSGFIDAHRVRFGVAPICRVLTEHGMPIAPETYYAHLRRPASDRALRDERVLVEIRRVYEASRCLYGARKVYHQLAREGGVDGEPVARCTVERLMRTAGLQGIRRDRRVHTTIPDRTAPRPADLVKREFTASRPNALWVVDFTYVATFSGFVYVAFAVDVFSRMIVGWRAARTMTTELPLDALDMALWHRGRAGHDVTGVVHHSDAGSQGGFNRSSQHLVTVEVLYGTTAAAGGSGSSARDAFAGTADPGQACGASVLASDRARAAHRGSGGRDRRVCAGGVAVVSARWRYAAFKSDRAHRPISVLRGT